MNWGDRKCEICRIEPCDPHSKQPLCTQCLIREMKAFRERVEKELRRPEE